MSFWNGKKVLITGGVGFVGSYLVKRLIEVGGIVRVVDTRQTGRLPEGCEFMKGNLTRLEDSIKAAEGCDAVFHLAGVVRGIDYTKSHPASIITPNILINTNTLEAARIAGVERYLFTSTANVYPSDISRPLKEEDFLKGQPASEKSSYAWTKILGELQAKAYHEEYGMRIAVVRPFNIYGPGDRFEGEGIHVIPSLIKRALNREKPFRVWGFGSAVRSFIYAKDVVEGMVKAIEKYPTGDAINLGPADGVTIKRLADMILTATDHHDTEVVFEHEKPQGQKIVLADTSKARNVLQFETKMPLSEGIGKTVKYYLKQSG